MAVEIRAIRPDEFEDATDHGSRVRLRSSDGDGRFLRLLPLDRSRCGFDGGKMISTSGAHSASR